MLTSKAFRCLSPTAKRACAAVRAHSAICLAEASSRSGCSTKRVPIRAPATIFVITFST